MMTLKTLLLFLLAFDVFAGTYYISKSSGLDSRASAQAQSKSTPWAHLPGMAGCSGACASYTPIAGDRFILKGGDTWTANDLGVDWIWAGTSGNRIYVGVDQTWFTGDSWSRPVLNAERDASIDGIINVSAQYVTIDNVEVKGLLIASNSWLKPSIGVWANNVTISNCYVHDWQAGPSVTTDDANGGILGNFYAGNLATGTVIDGCVISNAENAAKMNGVAVRMIETVRNTVIHDVPTAILFARYVHGNTFYNIDYPVSDFDSNYHTNLVYFSLPDGHSGSYTYMMYDNLFYSVRSGTNIYAEVCFGDTSATQYIFNNVIYDLAAPIPTFTVDPEGGSGACGNVYIWNNTAVRSAGDPTATVLAYENRSGTNRINALVVQNNHFVADSVVIADVGVVSFTGDHNVAMTPAQATAAGFTEDNAYLPDGGTALSGAAVNLTAQCGALSGLCFDKLANARPTVGAWDAGAYNATTTTPPNITTTTATSITSTTASSGGNVTSDGGASVTARGVCYATTANPTTPCTSDGTGTGAFTSSLTGLSAGTLYHYRAYATNSAGTSYGTDLTFTTATPTPPTITSHSTPPVVSVQSTLQFTADGPVTWSLAPGSKGSINSSGLYTAPSSIVVKSKVGGCQAWANDHILTTRVDDPALLHSQSSTWMPLQSGLRMSVIEDTMFHNITTSAHPTAVQSYRYTPQHDGVMFEPSWPDDQFQGGSLISPFTAGDRHVFWVTKDTCEFQEVYAPRAYQAPNTWTAASGVKYDLSSSYTIPQGTTSAIGIPLIPALLKLADFDNGVVQHALEVTFSNGYIRTATWVWPGTSGTSAGTTSTDYPPYGTRFRLKSDFDITGFSPYAQMILTAFKEYGIYIADGGTNFSVGVDADVRQHPEIWAALQEIRNTGPQWSANFEAVDLDSLKISNAIGLVRTDKTPDDFVEVIATNAAGEARMRVMLRGITVGVEHQAITIQSGTTKAIETWVHGTANQSVTWTVPENGGSVIGGVYTPPVVSEPTWLTLTVASVADPTATTKIYVTVLPAGDIRIDAGGKSTAPATSTYQYYTTSTGYGPDPGGKMWWFDTGMYQGVNYLHDQWWQAPWSQDFTGWPSLYSGRGWYGDGIYRFIVPPGQYNVSAYVTTVSDPSSTIKSGWIDVNGVLSSAIDLTSAPKYSYQKVTMTTTVGADGELQIAHRRRSDNDGSTYATTVLAGIEITADTAPSVDEAIVSAQAGNWSSTTTWIGGSVPSAGDTVTLNHAVTVDVNTTVGHSPNAGDATPAIMIGANGRLTIASNVELRIRGDVKYAQPSGSVQVDIVTMNPGSVWTFDPSAAGANRATAKYVYAPSSDIRGYALFKVRGVAGNPAIIRTLPGETATGRFHHGGFVTSINKVDMEHVILRDLGESTAGNEAFQIGSSTTVFKNALIERCGPFKSPANRATNTWAIFRDVTFKDSVGTYNLHVMGTTAVGTGGRTIERVFFDKGFGGAGSHLTGYTVSNVVFGGSTNFLSTGPAASMSNIVWVHNDTNPATSTPINIYNSLTNAYFVNKDPNNPHFIQIGGAASLTMDGVILHHDGNDTGGDGFMATANSGATHTLRRCIVLPNTSGADSSATLLSFVANTSPSKFNIEHCTFRGSGTYNHGVFFAEGAATPAGSVPSYKSNLYWDTTTRSPNHPPSGSGANHFMHQYAGAVDNMATPANITNNAAYNYLAAVQTGKTSDGTAYDIPTTVTAPGANDLNGVNPQFVDTSRNIQKWAVTQGQPETIDGALAALQADITKIDDLLTWVRAGFAPQNAAYATAAHDGTTIGAVEYAGAAGTPPTISTLTLPSGTVGTPYSQTITATGDPTPTCSVTSGAAPTGLVVNSDCTITGTPSVAQSATFTVTADNDVEPNASQAYTVVISPAPVTTSRSIDMDGRTGTNTYPAGWTSMNDIRIEMRIHDLGGFPTAVNWQAIWEVAGLRVRYGGVGTDRLAVDMPGYGAVASSTSMAGYSDILLRVQHICSSRRYQIEVWNWDGTGYQGTGRWVSENVPACPTPLSGAQSFGNTNTRAKIAWVRAYNTPVTASELAVPSKFDTDGLIAAWDFNDDTEAESVAGITTAITGETYVNTPAHAPVPIAKMAGQPFWMSTPVVRAGVENTLDGTGSLSYSETQGVTCSWTQASGPSTLYFDNANSCTPKVKGWMFGEYGVALTATDADGLSSTPTTLTIGSTATDERGIVVVPSQEHSDILGPLTRYGADRYPYYDERIKAFLDELQDRMDDPVNHKLNAASLWNKPEQGTVSVTNNSAVVTGSGTQLQTLFCGAGLTTPKANSPKLVVWAPLSASFDSSLRGRIQYPVASCESETQVTLNAVYRTATHILDGSGLQYSYSDDTVVTAWGFNESPFDYYDAAMAAYAMYYRSGLTKYRTLARRIADEWFQYPMLSMGAIYSVDGDRYNANQRTAARRNMALVGIFMRMLDGKPEYMPGLMQMCDFIMTGSYAGGGFRPDYNGALSDVRELAYALQFMSMGARYGTNSGHIANAKDNLMASVNTMVSGRLTNYAQTNGTQKYYVQSGANTGVGYVGTGTMPYQLSLMQNGIHYAIGALNASGNPTYEATATAAKSLIEGMGEYYRQTAKSAKGIYYTVGFDSCPDPHPTCLTNYGRGYALEIFGGLSLGYRHSGYTNTNLRDAADVLACELFGKSGYGSTCVDSNPLDLTSTGAGTFFGATDTYLSKWVGQLGGNSRTWALTAERSGGPIAPDQRTYRIQFRMADVPSAASAQLLVTEASGKQTTVQCASSPCTFLPDRRQAGAHVTLQYLDGSSNVLASGDPMPLSVQ